MDDLPATGRDSGHEELARAGHDGDSAEEKATVAALPMSKRKVTSPTMSQAMPREQDEPPEAPCLQRDLARLERRVDRRHASGLGRLGGSILPSGLDGSRTIRS